MKYRYKVNAYRAVVRMGLHDVGHEVPPLPVKNALQQEAGHKDQEGGEYRQRMDVYKPNGDAVFSQEFTYDYTYADIDGDTIFLYNEDSCRVYNRYGNLKYEGPLDFSVSKMIKGSLPNQFLAAGPQAIKEIKLH